MNEARLLLEIPDAKGGATMYQVFAVEGYVRAFNLVKILERTKTLPWRKPKDVRAYTVAVQGGRVVCDCYDWLKNGQYGMKDCKHIRTCKAFKLIDGRKP